MNEPDRKAVGDRIRIARVALGYNTSKEFAGKLGLSTGFMSDVENGRSKPSMKMLAGMAELGIDVSELLTGEPGRSTVEPVRQDSQFFQTSGKIDSTDKQDAPRLHERLWIPYGAASAPSREPSAWETVVSRKTVEEELHKLRLIEQLAASMTPEQADELEDRWRKREFHLGLDYDVGQASGPGYDLDWADVPIVLLEVKRRAAAAAGEGRERVPAQEALGTVSPPPEGLPFDEALRHLELQLRTFRLGMVDDLWDYLLQRADIDPASYGDTTAPMRVPRIMSAIVDLAERGDARGLMMVEFLLNILRPDGSDEADGIGRLQRAAAGAKKRREK